MTDFFLNKKIGFIKIALLLKIQKGPFSTFSQFAIIPGPGNNEIALCLLICRMADREQYKYIDGLPNSHKLTIGGLRMNTLYLFSVMSWNELGQSSYLPDLARAETKGKSAPQCEAFKLAASAALDQQC